MTIPKLSNLRFPLFQAEVEWETWKFFSGGMTEILNNLSPFQSSERRQWDCKDGVVRVVDEYDLYWVEAPGPVQSVYRKYVELLVARSIK